MQRVNGADVSALPLLLPLLDLNITLPNGSNSTVFKAIGGTIFRFYKRKIQKARERKAKLKDAIVERYGDDDDDDENNNSKKMMMKKKKGKWSKRRSTYKKYKTLKKIL